MSIDKVVDQLTLRNPDTLNYLVTLRNTGNVPLSSVAVTDALDGQAAIPLVLTRGDTNGDNRLDLTETWEYELSYAVDQVRINTGQPIVNQVQATAASLSVPVTDNATTIISQDPGLLVDKDVDRDTILRPGTLNYTISVTNTGNVDLINVTPVDFPHTGPSFPLSNPTGDNAPLGVLNPGETWVYTATYAVSQAQLEIGDPIVNRAEAEATDTLNNYVDDDSVATTPAKAPSILLTKSADRSTMAGPGTINYTVSLANTGNVSLDNVVVQDTLPDGTAGTLTGPAESGAANGLLDVGETWTYGISYAVDQTRFNQGGAVTNSVNAVTNLTPTPQTATAATQLLLDPALSVDKTVDTATISAPATLNYTIVVGNIGNVPLTGVVLTDTLPDGTAAIMSGPVETGAPGGTASVLDIGEVWTYTTSFVADQADIDAGTSLVNNASLLADAPDGTDVVGADSATTTIAQNFALQVEKDVDVLAVHDAGELLTYTIRVTNTGNGTLRNVVINDTLPDGQPAVLVGPSGDTDTDNAIDIGETWVYTTTYVVTQVDLDGESLIENSVTVSATGAAPVTDVADTVATDDPEILVSKAVDRDTISAPGPLSYTITVHNTGNQTLRNVVATDHLPSGAGDVVLAAPVESGATGVNTPGLLDIGEVWTYTVGYTATQADIDAGAVLVNGVDITAEDTRSVGGPDIILGQAEARTNIAAQPALTVVKTVDRTSLDAPRLLTYLIRVQNTGNVSLTGLVLADNLISGIGQTPARGDTGTLGVLDVGETWEFDATYNVTQAQVDAGVPLTNTASVTTDQPDASGSGSATTVFSQMPALVVEKTVTPLSISQPGRLTYTITVRNAGNVSLTGAIATDTMPDGTVVTLSGQSGDAGTAGVLDVGETWSYQATYDVDQAGIDAGLDLVNSVSVDTAQLAPLSDSATTTVTQAPSLSLSKVADKEEIPGAELISYTITAVNTGNVSLTVGPGSVVDTLPDGTAGTLSGPATDTGTAGTIDVGETWTYTVNYTPTQAEIDVGAVLRNNVSLSAPQLTTPVTAFADTRVATSSGIAIAKTAGLVPDTGSPGRADAGDQIQYSVTVTNTGTVTANNLVVTDSFNGGPSTTLTCPSTTLTPAGSMTCTAYSYAVGQADVDAGAALNNSASVTGNDPAGALLTATATQSVDVAAAAPAVALTKTASAISDIDGNGPDQGDRIAYTFDVTNTGNLSFVSSVINDPMLGGAISCPSLPASLAPGASAACGNPVEYELTIADFVRGSVVNTAGVIASPATGPDARAQAQTNTRLVQRPGLEIVKHVDQGRINTPTLLNYTIFLTNTGNIPLTTPVVSDTLPDGSPGVLTGPFGDANTDGAIDVDEVWTYTTTYQATSADFVARNPLVNNAAIRVDQFPGGPLTAAATTLLDPVATLLLQKTVDRTQVSVPTRLTYTITLTNTGNQPLTNVLARDTLPDGTVVPLTNPQGDLDGDGVLDPGEVWTYTTTYDVTQDDIDAGVNLVGTASVTTTEITQPLFASAVTVPSGSADIVLTKQAGLRQIRMGEIVPFTIRLSNQGPNDRGLVTLTDITPSGFRFVDGSALLDGVAFTPAINGLNIAFENVPLPAGSTIVIELRLQALSTATPGRYVNRARATDAAGNQLSPDATASVEIIAEPVFDCAELIGRVFDDRDRDGYMDDGEPGLPGVRIATVYGQLITTDTFGRYSVPCADMPNAETGSNFVLKVDTRTLPSGYTLTTPNPEGIRLTAGKMSKINFGASEGRVVAIELSGDAFVSGSPEPSEPLHEGVGQLIAALHSEPSLLRITYDAGGDSADLIVARFDRLRELINAAWRVSGAPYQLEIEMLMGKAR